MDVKYCPRCGVERPLSDFYYSAKCNRYSSYCKICDCDIQRIKRKSKQRDESDLIEVLVEYLDMLYTGNESELFTVNLRQAYKANEREIERLNYNRMSAQMRIGRFLENKGFERYKSNVYRLRGEPTWK